MDFSFGNLSYPLKVEGRVFNSAWMRHLFQDFSSADYGIQTTSEGVNDKIRRVSNLPGDSDMRWLVRTRPVVRWKIALPW